MQLRSALLLAHLAAAPPIPAQVPAVHTGWHLGGGVELLRFGHVAVSNAEGVEVELGPAGRLAGHLAIGRSVGAWDLALEAGWAAGGLEARSDEIAVRDLTGGADRYRLALAVGRHLAELGTGRLGAELAPTLDLWSVDGTSRMRAGAEARLALRVPLGGVQLEQRIGFGVSGSPFDRVDVGGFSEQRWLRTLMVGVGLRTAL